MRKEKLIAIDIDGTLSTGDPLEIPKPVIDRLLTCGHHIVLASGRTISEIKDFNLDVGMIGTNGGAAYRDGQLLFDSSIDLAIAEQLIDWIKTKGYIYQVHTEDKRVVELNADIFSELALIANMVEGNEQRLDRFNFVYNHVYGRNFKVDDVIEYIKTGNHIIKKIEIFRGPDKTEEIDYINNNFDLSAFSSVATNIEIVPRNINKGTALQKYNHDDKYEIYAIGDGDNDIPMFKVAKASFVMANGSDSAKQHGDHLVPSVEDMGVLQALDIIDTL